MKVAEILNSFRNTKLLAIKGNCDAEVDEMISEFKLEDRFNGNKRKRYYFTHGQKYNIENIPYEDFDVLMYGHFLPRIYSRKGRIYFANPGSIALLKCNTEHSYIIEENEIILKNVDGDIIDKSSK